MSKAALFFETTSRHIKALSLKNWANSKRQPLTSLCYIIFPGLLMLILVWTHTLFSVQVLNEATIEQMKEPKFLV